MIVYTTIISMVVFCKVIFPQDNKNIFVISSFFILFLPCAFRSSTVGADTLSYIDKFLWLGERDWKYIFNSYYEPGYAIMNKILYMLCPHGKAISVLNAFFINLFFYMFMANYSPNIYASVYIYITLLVYTNTMNGARQYLAVALVYLGYGFIVKRKKVSYILLVLFASTIHVSVLLMLVLYYLYNIKFTKKRLCLVGIAAGVMYGGISAVLEYFINIPVFSRYAKYLDNHGTGRGRTLIMSLTILLFVVVFMGKKKMVRKRNCGVREAGAIDNGIKNLLYWQLVLSSVFYLFTIKFYLLIRFAEMFAVSNIILIPFVLENVIGKINKIIVKLAVYLCLLIYFFLAVIFTPMQHTIPFTFGG